MKKKLVWTLVVCLLLAALPLGLAFASAGGGYIFKTLTAAETVTYPSADGRAVIDATYTGDGFLKIRYAPDKEVKTKVIIKGPDGVKYTYNLNSKGNYETFPLTGGDGSYTVGVYRNTSGTSYSTVMSKSITVALRDPFAPFLNPNQYVNYTAESKTAAKAAELTKGETTELGKVGKVYHYIVNNFSYDYDKAATVKSGYLPDVDATLESKKGICFDYAAVMAAMLRSQGVPTRLVVGYAGTQYHAWISVYTEDSGWVESVIWFDGTAWRLMDPTYASSGYTQYANTAANYAQKYIY